MAATRRAHVVHHRHTSHLSVTHPAEGLLRRLVDVSRVKIPVPVRSWPKWSRRIPTRITNGIGHGHPRACMKTIVDKAAIPKVRTPHRTLRFLLNLLLINNLREQRNFSFPIPFPISIWTQSHSAGLSEPTGDGWRIGLHSPDGLPAALVPLLELVPDLVVLMDAAQRRARAACSSIEQPR